MIEQWEDAAERWAAENVCGENFICGCGQQCKLDEGIMISPNPYAPPVCPDCAKDIEHGR